MECLNRGIKEISFMPTILVVHDGFFFGSLLVLYNCEFLLVGLAGCRCVCVSFLRSWVFVEAMLSCYGTSADRKTL